MENQMETPRKGLTETILPLTLAHIVTNDSNARTSAAQLSMCGLNP